MDELIRQLTELEQREKQIAAERSVIIKALSERMEIVFGSLRSTDKLVRSTPCDNESAARTWGLPQSNTHENSATEPKPPSTQLKLPDNTSSSEAEYVLVLINGNTPQFKMFGPTIAWSDRNDLHPRSLAGMVRKHFHTLFLENPKMKVVIQVYASLEIVESPLIDDCKRQKPGNNAYSQPILGKQESNFHTIWDSYLFEDTRYIDSVIKVRESFQKHCDDIRCKHIVLGSSRNDNYHAFIRNLTIYSGVEDRITFLDQKSNAPNHPNLAENFQLRSYRATSHLNGKNEPKITPDGNEYNQRSYQSGVWKAPLTDTWSSSATDAVTPDREVPGHDLQELSSDKESSTATDIRQMQFNKLGERIDSRITYDWATIKELKSRQLCLSFYILGRCRRDVGRCCNRNHDETLTERELLNLRVLARGIPCTSIHCHDPDCISGHQCLFNWKCTNAPCRFSEEMHKVDTEVVETIGSKD